jgi:hypothetical protein
MVGQLVLLEKPVQEVAILPLGLQNSKEHSFCTELINKMFWKEHLMTST